MTRWIALCAVLGGCSLETLVEPVDFSWPGDDLPACDTTRRAYRVDALRLPTNAEEADALGFDLDGDGMNDNRGGSLMSAVAQALGVDLQGAVEEALDGDLVQIGVTVEQCASPRYALVSPVRGIELDRSSGRARMIGEVVTSFPAVSVDGLPAPALWGTSKFPAGQLLHPIADEWIDSARLVVVVDEVSDDAISGTMIAALYAPEVENQFVIAFHAKVAERVEELGPCTAEQCDEVLRQLFGVFDADGDGEITLLEVRESSLTQTLIQPDIDTDFDGEQESLTIGVGFHATQIELLIEDVMPPETP